MPPSDRQEHDFDALEKRLTRLSEASMSINESLDSALSLTYARYGVMTLLDDTGQVQDFLSSGQRAQEAERLWIMPDGPRIFEALTNTPNRSHQPPRIRLTNLPLRHANEFAGRHNTKGMDDTARLRHTWKGMIGKRLRYADLIA